MIYVGGLNNNSMQSWAELVAMSVANNVPLTVPQQELLSEELAAPKYAGLSLGAKLVELSKSDTSPGVMPRNSCESDDFMVVRNRADLVASSPTATAQQVAVWKQVDGPSLGTGFQDSVDLTIPSVRGGLDGCYAVGLISREDYMGLIWEDSVRTAGWVERTFGAGYVLLHSDLEALD